MKKRNILLLTSIYPSDDTEYVATSVVHYFAREWVKMGYEVKVIYSLAVFPAIYYQLTKYFQRLIYRFVGHKVPTRRLTPRHYSMEGVEVYRFPIYKRIPHGGFSARLIDKQLQEIHTVMENISFKPDIIVGHWINPQLELIYHLKKKYGCTSALVFHADVPAIKKVYPENYTTLLESLNVLGFRSEPIRGKFFSTFQIKRPSFLCPSGIPSENLSSDTPPKSFPGKLHNFLYVGKLIRRKHPECLIQAIRQVYSAQEPYQINFVGEGGELPHLWEMVENSRDHEKISFVGQLKREEVQTYMNNSQCFIMISEHETFGLVYLEAMSKGCITIASNEGGMCGIIKDGENGFLCNPGDAGHLSSIIERINGLTEAEKTAVSRNAIITAQQYSDKLVAERYLGAILNPIP